MKYFIQQQIAKAQEALISAEGYANKENKKLAKKLAKKREELQKIFWEVCEMEGQSYSPDDGIRKPEAEKDALQEGYKKELQLMRG